jgi:hypothetical protein
VLHADDGDAEPHDILNQGAGVLPAVIVEPR